MLPPIPPDDLLPPFRETDWRYARAIAARGDTYLHLPTLRALVDWIIGGRLMLRRECGLDGGRESVDCSVVEFGVRTVVTTWAFLAARPRSLLSVDIEDPPPDALRAAEACAAEDGTDFRFVKADTLELPPVACDLLFIDTLHTATQLRAELFRHAAGVTRFIAMHDTVTFGQVGMDGQSPGLQEVVEDLVAGRIDGTGTWELRYHDERNNGLAVCERVG